MDPSDPLYYINQHYANLQAEAKRKRLENLRQMFEGTGVDIDEVLKSRGAFNNNGAFANAAGIGGQTIGGTPPPKQGSAPKWSSVEQMMRDLDKQRREQAARPKPPVVNKETRIAAIESELDIIRGRKPTPKGYKVDPSKVKALMTELKELKAK